MSRQFTLEEVLQLWIDEWSNEIWHILDQAKREYKYEVLVNETISKKYYSINLTTQKFKTVDSSDLYILSEYDSTMENLDDDILNLEIF